MHFRELLADMGLAPEGATPQFIDNDGAVALYSRDRKSCHRSRHSGSRRGSGSPHSHKVDHWSPKSRNQSQDAASPSLSNAYVGVSPIG